MNSTVKSVSIIFFLLFFNCSNNDNGPGFIRNFANCTVIYQNNQVIDVSDQTCREYDEKCPCSEGACSEIFLGDSAGVQYNCLEDGNERVYVVTNATENINVENPHEEVLVIFNNSESDTLSGDINVMESAVTHIVGTDKTESVMQGNVNLHSGRATLRNVTIMGDVSLNDMEDSTGLSHCEIQGNLNIHTVGTTVKNCNIFGNINIDRDSVSLINVGIMGELALHGVMVSCSNFYSFDDLNQNWMVEPSEVGSPVNCILD